MSNLLLTQLVANYLNSWEGHTQTEGNNFIILRDRLTTATIDEINTEYNALTQQQLWVTPLLDIFYDEIRGRMFDDTTFAISTTWRSVSEWKQHPFVLIRVGFEDAYPVIDGDGSFIRANDPNISSFTLMNDSFEDELQEKIIRLLLHHDLNAIVQVGADNQTIQIVGLENAKDPDDRFSFVGNVLPSINGETTRISAKIRENPDWNINRQIYEALRTQRPVIVDPMQDRLINQLIDLDEARDILEDGGFTFEGNLVLEAEAEAESDEEYEEPIELL